MFLFAIRRVSYCSDHLACNYLRQENALSHGLLVWLDSKAFLHKTL